MTITTGELARMVNAELLGPGDVAISGPNTMDLAGPDQITFIRSETFAKMWAGARAGAALVTRGLKVGLAEGQPRRALLVVDDADLAMIELLKKFQPPAMPTPPGVHPTALVDAATKLPASVHVGPYCVIGPSCRIGEGVVIHSHVVLGGGVVIGPKTVLHARVVVGDRCTIGAMCILNPGAVIGADGFGYRPAPDGRGVIKIPHAGNVEIQDGVEIGANSCVDRGKFGPTVIGAGTKVDNLVQIAHNVRVGRMCLIAGCVGIGGSSKIGDGVMIGGHAGVRDNIEIGAMARIGAMSGVMQDVAAGVTVGGSPARAHREFLRETMTLKRLAQEKRHT